MQYLQELSPGRNVIFATGTPISNSIAEMYVMQKYLASDSLKERDIYAFDLWASNFGKVETTLELAPEGNRYREKQDLPSLLIHRSLSRYSDSLRM